MMGPMPLAIATTAPCSRLVSDFSCIKNKAQTYQNALVFSSFPQRHDIANNQLRDSHETTSTDTRKRAKDGELQN